MSGDDAWAIPSVEELLAHGGWALLDPRPMATRNPDTFELPTPAALAALDRGSAVRAAAATLTIADEVSEGGPPYDDRGHPRLCATVERMWFVVLDRRDDDLLCHLDSLPLATHTRLTRGARLTLPTTHLIATDVGPGAGVDDYLRTHREIGFPGLDEADAAVPEDPLRDPTVPPSQEAVCTDAGVRPHPPFLFARLLAGRDLVDGAFPVHGARFAPQSERGDCGWIVWSGDRDLETAADDTGFEIVSVQELHERCAEAGHYLALPPAWGFTLDGADRGEAYPIDIVD